MLLLSKNAFLLLINMHACIELLLLRKASVESWAPLMHVKRCLNYLFCGSRHCLESRTRLFAMMVSSHSSHRNSCKVRRAVSSKVCYIMEQKLRKVVSEVPALLMTNNRWNVQVIRFGDNKQAKSCISEGRSSSSSPTKWQWAVDGGWHKRWWW
jgi:hypothetical protein